MTTSSNETIPSPFSWAPSQYWNGNDGSWSSFIVRVGTPAQDFEIFPSTMGQETLIPVPEGCTSSDPSNCGASRGVLPAFGAQGTGFLTNDSSTWDLIGIYTSNLEDTLGYRVNGEYGFDTVGLEVENSGGLTVNHSVVAGIADKSFYVGVMGLGPKPSNFSTLSDPQPSFMKLLNSTKQIPSISYGFTAGASYSKSHPTSSANRAHLLNLMLTVRSGYSKIDGSLTLGGYDSSRFEPSDLVIPFASDDSRPLQVAIQGITGESTLLGTNSLLPNPIYANIDTTLPYIWLPQAACDNFANAFGLTYDNETDLYLVNETIHTNLTDLNPTVTFKLGSGPYTGTTQNIVLPYGAFDLEASYPIYTNSTRYFPIRRAANDTQYTLGRAFMQEAYVIADYERNNFTIAQANFSATMPDSQIVAIISPGYNLTTTNGTTTGTTNNGHSISSGAIAGIVVGSIVGVALVVLGIMFYLRRRRRQTKGDVVSSTDPDTVEPKVELGDEVSSGELGAEGAKHELPGPLRPNELQGDDASKWSNSGIQELQSEISSPELDGGPMDRPPKWIHEAEGSPARVYELPGTEVETDKYR